MASRIVNERSEHALAGNQLVLIKMGQQVHASEPAAASHFESISKQPLERVAVRHSPAAGRCRPQAGAQLRHIDPNKENIVHDMLSDDRDLHSFR